jgi:hypothetical protein
LRDNVGFPNLIVSAASQALKIREENTMFPSIRSSVKRILFKGKVHTFLIIALTLFPLLASGDEDHCRETGIYISNQIQLNSYFTMNGGPCTYWRHHFLLAIKPEDTLIVYRDVDCKTERFSKNPTYDVYKSLDANQDCRVRILLDGTLSDL